VAAVHKALDAGITYIDTADDYSNHLSERRIGMALAGGKRNGIFLATKLTNRNGAESFRVVEESLKALQTDHVDLLHIHSLQNPDDLAAIEAKGGVLEQLQKMRDQKMTRFIGITCHFDPTVLKTALERHDFDCTQMALNGAMVGMEGNRMVPNRALKTSFQTVALPVANQKKMGVIGMKVFAQEALLPAAAPDKLLSYTLSLPVTAAVVGMPKLEHIEANARVARDFKPLSRDEMERISGPLSHEFKASLDEFFRDHVDA
jgi:predicted aldo/keto reductase-like oxidoreductase